MILNTQKYRKTCKNTGPFVLKRRLGYLLPFNLSLNIPQAKLGENEEKRQADHSV